MWSLKKDEGFTKQPSDGGRLAAECEAGSRQLLAGSRGQRPGSREVSLGVMSWL